MNMQSPPTILIVDDEQGILDLVSAYMRNEGFQVITAASGKKALGLFHSEKPDLLILDIMLPEMDGLQVLQEIRKESNVYVIMLTARAEEFDKVLGLTVGADDYVSKPFSPRELTARVIAALRRIQGSTPQSELDEIKFNDLRIERSAHRVWLAGETVELTTTEFDLLVNLAENAGRVLTREQLLENIWGHAYFGELRVVDVHISHLRQKIGAEYIETVRGIGFRFEGKSS
jgi:two-component system alkaline phosphatase synthesis response regulator PhoP